MRKKDGLAEKKRYEKTKPQEYKTHAHVLVSAWMMREQRKYGNGVVEHQSLLCLNPLVVVGDNKIITFAMRIIV